MKFSLNLFEKSLWRTVHADNHLLLDTGIKSFSGDVALLRESVSLKANDETKKKNVKNKTLKSIE